MAMKEVKLVIWDLDDTLWTGTLAEGEPVRPRRRVMDLVAKLTDRGIVNSIVSRNHLEQARRRLKRFRLWKYFIFPQIDFVPKGPAIRDVVQQCRLRPENVLFIDDLPQNRHEARHHCPGIQCLDGTNPHRVIRVLNRVKEKCGKDDPSHSRLRQYKILAVQTRAQLSFGNNEQFLRKSCIRISYLDAGDCRLHLDRIAELVQRTNQLNYTKRRDPIRRLARLIANPNCVAWAVHVVDRFGDHGICGFVCYNSRHRRMIHFAFSCRVMSMGIESFVFYDLNCPDFETNGEVAHAIADTKPDWIGYHRGRVREETEATSARILLSGICDTKTVYSYLQRRDETEFLLSREEMIDNVLADQLSDKERASVDGSLPKSFPKRFPAVDFSKYDYLVFSMLNEYVYECHQSVHVDRFFLRVKPQEFVRVVKNHGFENGWRASGKPAAVLRQQLQDYFERLSAVKKRAVLILGSEDPFNLYGADPSAEIARRRRWNPVIRRIAGRYERIHLVHMDSVMTSPADFNRHTRHYPRHVYLALARSIDEVIQ